jgi:Tfp pilus assembly ATPase PilU
MNVKPLFKLMVEKQASDLFFAPFSPAKIKIEGKIMPVNKLEMTPKMVKQAAIELMDDDQLEHFYNPAWAVSASTCSTSAATFPWCCATLPTSCRTSTSSACRRSSRN